MGVYNKTIITNAGINAIAQAIAESQTLAFKTAKTSSYAIPDGTSIRAMTSLRDIVQSVELPTPTVYNSNTVQVYARFSNTNIASEYYINTIGVYASLAGGAEFLFAVLTAITPDRQPVFDENSPTAFIYNIMMQISEAESITFAVNDTGAATVADINRLQNLIDGKVNTIGGNVSGTVVNTPIDSADPFPIPAAGDSIAVIVGKIIKFFADILNPFTGATNNTAGEKGIVPAPAAGDNVSVLRGDGAWAKIQNNITTDTPGTPLDAQMGYRMCLVLNATLPASGWTGTAPYTNTIGIFGMTAAYAPVIACGKVSSPTAEKYKAIHKAYAMIDRAVTGNNQITFYCYSKKPTVDIPISIKGV